MWYKSAITSIDPTGQINFPDMGGHKFNLNDLKFKVRENNYPGSKTVVIHAFIPAVKHPIGELVFEFDRINNIIDIEGVIVEKIGKIRLQRLQQQHNDPINLRTTGIGIGNKLYEKFLEIIHNDEEMSKEIKKKNHIQIAGAIRTIIIIINSNNYVIIEITIVMKYYYL